MNIEKMKAAVFSAARAKNEPFVRIKEVERPVLKPGHQVVGSVKKN